MAMEPINNVRIGNSQTGSTHARNAKTSEEQVNQNLAQNLEQQTKSTYNPDSILTAMGYEGAYNMMQINKSNSLNNVNPSDYLSEERISDIEAMMAEFETGVNNTANVIEGEFPGMFTEEQKNALAAQIFAYSPLLFNFSAVEVFFNGFIFYIQNCFFSSFNFICKLKLDKFFDYFTY